MININYKSNFIVEERCDDGGVLPCVPFTFTYYVSHNKEAHVASYDGRAYHGCSPTNDGLGVIVSFDSPIGIGRLRVDREYRIRDARYADGVCNAHSVELLDVELGKGSTDSVRVCNLVRLPFNPEEVEAGVAAEVRDGILILSGSVSGDVIAITGSVINNILHL